jgi:transcriptional regulator GlxA family with amidase domain
MPGLPLNGGASSALGDLVTNRLQESWSVDRIARAAGVSHRTLHRVFLRHYGVSPMTWLRRARLEAARRTLEASAPGTTVTRVALDCGFAHLGRFSIEYAKQFGVSPSETLRQARQRQGPSVVDTVAREFGAQHGFA